jgi:RNA polymerase sigma factor (sigma-70 family)
MDIYEEQAYIQRIRAGESSVYGILVDRYKALAFSIALKVLGNAEDVAQEGFIKAYQQLHLFEGKSKFSTWLYTIVYRTALAQKKKGTSSLMSITEYLKETFADSVSTPQLVKLEEKDDRYFVEKAVNNLPETEGLLVILYYLNENSIKEIQQITGLSSANIKIKLFRARKKLERELKFLLDHQTDSRYGKKEG